MGWMQKLCEVYEAGILCDQSKEAVSLVPIGFVNKKIKYHVILTRDGRFVSADEIPEKEQLQQIPSTPQAESRTGSSGAPFPLAEQLKYLVYSEENSVRFQKYMEQLDAWSHYTDAPDCLRTVYDYLNGHTLLTDLESQPSIKLKYYKEPESREGVGDDAKAMLCFSVQMEDEDYDELWRRSDVRKSWSSFLTDRLPGERDFCYVEGKELPIVENHPKLQGNAKLISAKDAEFPFQYRGRFIEERSAAMVSFDASVRAHNALNWLIARQGLQKYGMTWVVWNTNGAFMRVPVDNEAESDAEDDDDEENPSLPVIDTFQGYAKAVHKAAEGYAEGLQRFNQNQKRVNCAVILGLEAATDGRMSVTYYQECPGNEYVKRLESWYMDCCWWGYDWKKKRKEIRTPNADQLAVAVMGQSAVSIAKRDKKNEKSQTKILKKLNSEILSCIIDGQPIPLSMVRNAFARATAPLGFSGGKEQQWSRSAWESSMNAACALIYCFQKRGQRPVVTPELQEDVRHPDYLYGRLLAVADVIEEQAAKEGRDRITNAVRFMKRFVQKPAETWLTIHNKLLPYLKSLGDKAEYYQKLFEGIEALFDAESRSEDRVLLFEFLQGFSSQRQKLYQKWQKEENEAERGTIEPFRLPTTRSELYGALVAIADVAEKKGRNTESVGLTNAMRLMPVISVRPYETWERLHGKAVPYLESLQDKGEYYQRLIGLLEMQFDRADRESREPLDGSCLHGYYVMRRTLYRAPQYVGQPQDWQETDDLRSLLYGRMLGLAERLERRKVVDTEIKRVSNELRFISAFAKKPASVWKFLRLKLNGYRTYSAELTEEEMLLEQLEKTVREQGWDTDIPLGSIYLHGYYNERNK